MTPPARAALPLNLYFDGSCPLCRAEMTALKAADTDNRLILLDCSADAFFDAAAAREGVEPRAMLAAMHVRDASGRWYVGVAAFEQIYACVGFDRVSAVLGQRRLRPLLDRVYAWVARNRPRLARLGVAPLIGFVLKRSIGRAARRRGSCGDGGCNAG